MSTEYKINNTTKWGMLSLALIFDGIQLVTPGIMDTLITATATMVFGMLFIEKGVLTISGTGALKIFRIVVPLAELFISHIPGITLTVWIQIKISRIADEILPEQIHTLWGMKRLKGDIKDITKERATIKHTAKQMRRYAQARSVRAKRRAIRSMYGDKQGDVINAIREGKRKGARQMAQRMNKNKNTS